MIDWEKDLSPVARERLSRIGELTREERERIKDSEQVDSLLSEFYQGQLEAEGLWKKLKKEGQASLLQEAQMKMIDSLNLRISPAEFRRRKDGILAIETLKGEQNTSAVELNLNLMAKLRERYEAEIEQAYNNVRSEVEKNPQLRLKQVQQGQDAVIVQLTIEEAIQQVPQWKEFLSDHEKRYSQEFANVVEGLKRELK